MTLRNVSIFVTIISSLWMAGCGEETLTQPESEIFAVGPEDPKSGKSFFELQSVHAYVTAIISFLANETLNESIK